MGHKSLGFHHNALEFQLEALEHLQEIKVQEQEQELMFQKREQMQQRWKAGKVGLLAVAFVRLTLLALVLEHQQPVWLQQQMQSSWLDAAGEHPQSSQGGEVVKGCVLGPYLARLYCKLHGVDPIAAQIKPG